MNTRSLLPRSVVRSCLLVGALVAASRAQAEAPTCLYMWGGNPPLLFPSGITINSAGIAYVADTGNNRIVQATASGTTIRTWGSAGSEPGQFSTPLGLATGPDGNVYVADYMNNRVQVFTADGVFLRAWGEYGDGPGELQGPRDVAVDRFGNVHVVDSSPRVQVFTPMGQFIEEWGRGYVAGVPTSVAFNDLGWAYLTVATSNTVLVRTGQSSYVTWKTFDLYPGIFRAITSIAVDHSGNVYVTDRLNNLVQEFTATGKFVRGWGQDQYPYCGAFHSPMDVATDDSGFIHVVDTNDSRIVVYGDLPVAAAHSSWGQLKVLYR